MAYEDLPLTRPASETPTPERTGSPTRWVILGAAAVIVGALLTLWWMSRARPTPTTPAPTTATDVALGSKRPQRQDLDLPSLDGSDSFLRDIVSTLSKHPLLARLLATRGLVRAATLAVVQIGEGKTPATPLAALKPATRLQIIGTTSGQVDPASYARWNGPTNALVEIDPAQAAQVYVNIKQLFDEAYRELSGPGANFDAAIVRAMQTLEATPEPKSAVLLRRPGYFEHDDPALRGLLPVQKQLLLIGPDNRRKVQTWLRQLAMNLDLKID